MADITKIVGKVNDQSVTMPQERGYKAFAMQDRGMNTAIPIDAYLRDRKGPDNSVLAQKVTSSNITSAMTKGYKPSFDSKDNSN